MDMQQLLKNIREVGFILGCLLLLYLFVALLTYYPGDPSAGQTRAPGEAVRNWGGIFGAYLAFGLLEWFGYSAFLLSFIGGLFLYSVLLKPIAYQSSVGWMWACVGVLLFMLASSSLEYLRYASEGELPGEAGGLVGKLLGESMATYFGNFGASLLFAGIWLLSWSLAANLSWFAFFERVGAAAERAVSRVWRRVSEAWAARQREAANSGPIIAEPTGISPKPTVAEGEVKKAPIFGNLRRKKDSAAEDDKNSGGAAGDGGDGDGEVRKAPIFNIRKPKAKKAEGERDARGKERDSTQGDGEGSESGRARAGGGKSGSNSGAPPEPAPLPSLSLLDAAVGSSAVSQEAVNAVSLLIEQGLESFKISAKVVSVHPGPVVTRYDLQPATGVKGVQIANLSRDLARFLSVSAIRVMETIPGTNYIGLEIPNKSRQMVSLTEILSSPQYQSTRAKLPLALGKNAAGEAAVRDLAAMPHLLVAGSTGAGKSVFINAVLLSFLYSKTPEDVRLLLIDPKMLELATYADIPHLLAPVVTDMELAPAALNWAVNEMERRYRMMADAGVRNISGYNEAVAAGKVLDEDGAAPAVLQYLVIIIDELADLMMVAGKKVELFINRLAQKARAAGIHLILATQRPSVDVITGLIKANVPSRISFQVASVTDSRTILDQKGAETLLGKGDMLFLSPGGAIPLRLHGAYVSDDEIARVTESVRDSREVAYLTDFSVDDGGGMAGGGGGGGFGGGGGGGDFVGGGGEEGGSGEGDALYDEAVQVVLDSKRVSISLIQRKLRIGYNRASRLVEAMERAGLVSATNDYGVRTLIIKPAD